MTARHRISLVHATPVAIDPISTAFATLWPEAEVANLLDDALSRDRARDADLTPGMFGRIDGLAQYALSIGTDAILYTCSAFGPAIEAVAHKAPVPVLKPNEAMFEQALLAGTRIGMIATFAPAVATMEQEFFDAVALHRSSATLRTVLVEDAMSALRRNDAERHNTLVAAAAAELDECDAIMLAHFSTARAAAAVRKTTSRPVLTSPEAAVEKVKALLTRL